MFKLKNKEKKSQFFITILLLIHICINVIIEILIFNLSNVIIYFLELELI